MKKVTEGAHRTWEQSSRHYRQSDPLKAPWNKLQKHTRTSGKLTACFPFIRHEPNWKLKIMGGGRHIARWYHKPPFIFLNKESRLQICNCQKGSWNGSVGIVASLRALRTTSEYGSISGRDKITSSSPQRPDRLWYPQPPPSAEVQNAYRYTSAPSYISSCVGVSL
jgi:hypothetical protein